MVRNLREACSFLDTYASAHSSYIIRIELNVAWIIMFAPAIFSQTYSMVIPFPLVRSN